jgi:hypothetical protein
MTCDRARELISEYIEGGLGRPVARSIESHLAGCLSCQSEVDGVRSLWQDLEEMPVVSPPPDLLSHTLAEVRRRSHEAEWAASRPAPWLAWLRSLSPARVALATSLATLIVLGALLFPRYGGVALGLLMGTRPGADEPNSGKVIAAPRHQQVTLTVRYGALSGSTQNVAIVMRPEETLPEAVVQLRSAKSHKFLPGGGGTMVAREPCTVLVPLEKAATPEELTVQISSTRARFDQQFLCAIPFERRESGEPLSFTFVDTPLGEAARQFAEKTGRPVVLDKRLESLSANAIISRQREAAAWSSLLRPLNLRVVDHEGTYEVVSAG